MPPKMSISQITHPNYNATVTEWFKWRLTYEGGRRFIEEYLQKFSAREDQDDFVLRKTFSYNPAFAKQAIEEVKNAICQRMVDVNRVDGSSNYQKACAGLDGGVDRKGSSMDHFMSAFIIPELLTMKKVGIYVDMPPIGGETLLDSVGKVPYIYFYRAEDIRCWTDTGEVEGDFQSILLSEHVYEYDTDTGFPIGMTEQFRHIWRDFDETTGNPCVRVRIYNKAGKEYEAQEYTLNLPRLPFIVFELPHSLLEDIADYQIALLNLASSDINYSLKSNHTFYTEQFDFRSQGSPYAREEHYDENGNVIVEGTAANAAVSGGKEIEVGVTQGRAYPMGAERPGFIHPSSEPMKISMAKQEQLKEEIRLLTHLSVFNLSSSAESKEVDERGLENGLSFIGSVLQKGEQQLAETWAAYEGTRKNAATVTYPDNYSLRSDEDRRAEADELSKLMPTLPSQTFQRVVGKKIARILVGPSVSREMLLKIDSEIDAAPNMVSDPEIIATDVENGLVDPETASKLRGYPEGSAAKAEESHAKRAAAIIQAQATAGARGVSDLNPGKSKTPKVKDKTLGTSLKSKIRGKGK